MNQTRRRIRRPAAELAFLLAMVGAAVPAPGQAGDPPAPSLDIREGAATESSQETPAESPPPSTGFFGLPAAPIDDDLVTDRPDFTESALAVPRGRGQLEIGYTYTYDSGGGTRTHDHTYPEALLRLGLVDNVELRLSWSGWSHTEAMHKVRIDDRWTRVESRSDGCNDVGIGFKFHLLEQRGLRPELGVILETSLPTGADELSSDDVDPAVKWLWSYDLTDRLAVAGNLNFAVPTSEHGRYFETSASLTLAASLTDRLGSYVEYFGFYPSDRGQSDAHYLNGGFTFLITNNLQADIRVGMGLNEEADDLFSGIGMAWRF